MKLELNDKYRLRSDASQWHLEYRTDKKGGGLSDRYIAAGHYPDLRMAVKAAVDRGIRMMDASTLADAIAGIDEMLDKIITMISKMASVPESRVPDLRQSPETPADEMAKARIREANFDPKFKSWITANWHIYRAFERRALRLINLGFRHGGAREIVENIRWQSRLAEKESEYKINNNNSSRLARAFALLNPRHKDFFRFRGCVSQPPTEQP